MIFLKAFIVGGAICIIGQLLIDKTNLTPARILVTFVCAGAVLQLFGIYQPIISFAGAGASVPLSGFGATLTKGVVKAVNESGLAGVLSGGITSAAFGISAALIFGLLAAAIFSSKPGR